MKPERPILRRLFTLRALRLLVGGAIVLGISYVAFEARVAADFERLDAVVPTRILSRPLVLRPGARPDAADVRGRLERLGYRPTRAGTPERGRFGLGVREWRIGRRPVRIGPYFDAGGPARVRFDGDGRIRRIEDGEGRELRGLVLEPEIVGTLPGPRRRDRVPIRLSEVPEHLIQAILIVEDRRFAAHAGFDPRRIFGAAIANIREGRLVQGGSTLTQQLARTLFLDSERTFLRKTRETAIAIALERRYPKDRLLEAYLNHIYLGQDGASAIHGVGRAARFFFGKDVSELTLGESAMIAGIIRGPNLYSPHRHPDRARARRDLVLRMLHEEGRLDDAALEEELAAETKVRRQGADGPDARWYFDYLESEAARVAGTGRLGGAGLAIVSTLEPRLQRLAEEVVRARLAELERMRPRLRRQAGPIEAALVALDPWSGEILAMVGGRSYGASQFNRAAVARRQPGSAFKPVVALAALARRSGRPYTLASTLDDAPLRLETPAGVWAPSNADAEFLGPVSLRRALEESRNVPFARLGLAIGPERIVETARELGVESPLAPVPSLALGASEVTLLELTSAYAVLAAEGERTPPHAVRAVIGADGEPLTGAEIPGSTRPFSPAETYLVTSALRGVVETGTGTAVRRLGYRGPVAAKSGTTNGSRDAWFVGYTPELAVGVWVGFDDGTALGLTGSQAALPIFASFLRGALGPEGRADFRLPDGLERVEVDRDGRGWDCEGEPELFLAGTEPEDACRSWRLRFRGIRERWAADALEEAERWFRSRLRRRARVESGGG